MLRPRETLLPSTVRHRASEGPLSTPPIPTWRSLHCPGPRAPPSAGWGRPRGAGEALPDVLAATLLARRPWRLGEGESSVTSVLESWRMLFPGLGWAARPTEAPRPGQAEPTGPAAASGDLFTLQPGNLLPRGSGQGTGSTGRRTPWALGPGPLCLSGEGQRNMNSAQERDTETFVFLKFKFHLGPYFHLLNPASPELPQVPSGLNPSATPGDRNCPVPSCSPWPGTRSPGHPVDLPREVTRMPAGAAPSGPAAWGRDCPLLPQLKGPHLCQSTTVSKSDLFFF